MEKQTQQSGMSFTTVLFLIFLVLKMTKVIDWSWWWVTSPLWIPVVFLIGFCILLFLIVLVAKLFFD
jgi:hypothetical protein